MIEPRYTADRNIGKVGVLPLSDDHKVVVCTSETVLPLCGQLIDIARTPLARSASVILKFMLVFLLSARFFFRRPRDHLATSWPPAYALIPGKHAYGRQAHLLSLPKRHVSPQSFHRAAERSGFAFATRDSFSAQSCTTWL